MSDSGGVPILTISISAGGPKMPPKGVHDMTGGMDMAGDDAQDMAPPKPRSAPLRALAPAKSPTAPRSMTRR